MSDPAAAPRALGFDAFYGLELLELGRDVARAQLQIRDHHRQPFGLVHGGVYASMAEALASYATATVVVPLGQAASGMSNLTSFLRPVTEGMVHALATCKHAGRTTWVWEVEMSDDARRLCATSRVTVAVRDLPEAAQLQEMVARASDSDVIATTSASRSAASESRSARAS
ncbi:MAG TPA: PaaI family thioesterase [Solirubrobacteraceae bacterium]|nr:PaaI family thioesterase [Solirubrobacteraceae bacterium]